ncbi:endolytic transglycosylase MltG [Weissella tructae]|uniref:Endolytic murein transglycosylase n=2 Tax=Weissella TaxID=46255 RepID=A0A075U0C4_9LACO|nr:MULTISPECIES: endolytic transglycosylase MltG [Weissella]AIG65941.1 Aminodeoxychorismate lyase [Weissella tructae]AIM63319.1 Aminodeoxychorismate lyase [Weissella ceti]AIM64654.1 Aminodeoxychorismate lyase [Weissella ceti]ELA07312.1 aminodeoxychorismate lyase [Weissella ceti NC36]QVV91096.1 endolytic transglycosylase MltG [Weissella tructae]
MIKFLAKIPRWMKVLLVVVLIFIVGGSIFNGIQNDKKDYSALNTKDDKTREVRIKEGSSPKQMASALKEAGVLRSERAFVNYVSSENYTDLKAGYYQLSPAMPVKDIVLALRLGGSSVPSNNKNVILVREGEIIDDVAKQVGEKTNFSEKSFLKAVNDKELFNKLKADYPGLLDSAAKAKGVRYLLEGYLYPATYNWQDAETVEDLVTMMVRQEYIALKPYFKDIEKSGMTVHEVLTLASLVEREGVDKESRGKIAGVFLNRLDIDMPLQSDVSTKYALKTKRANLSIKDVQTKDAYNNYVHAGFGPGPMNNPSVNAVAAVLNPKDRDQDYLYFVANLKDGKIYYSHDYNAHLGLTDSVQADNDEIGLLDKPE